MTKDYSHTHCWNNQPSPCGIPMINHTQCCLCDMSVPKQNKSREEFDKYLLRKGFFNKFGQSVSEDIASYWIAIAIPKEEVMRVIGADLNEKIEVDGIKYPNTKNCIINKEHHRIISDLGLK